MGFVTTAAEIMAFLRSKGFTIETGRGKHGTKALRGGHKIPIPMHSRALNKATACKILSEAGYRPDDLMEWRRK